MTRLDFDLQFETTDQNSFGGKLAYTDDRFIGLNFDRGFNGQVPLPVIRDLNYRVFAEGKVGFQSTLDLNDGTVDAVMPVDLFFDLPDEVPAVGETLTIQSGFSFGTADVTNAGPSFKTLSPSVAYDLDLLFDVDSGVSVTGPINFQIIFDRDETIELISFDSTKPLSLDIENSLREINASIPNLQTIGAESSPGSNRFVSSGREDFARAALDLDGVVTNILGLPPLEGSRTLIDTEFRILPFLPKIKVQAAAEYNILDVEAAIGLALSQEFSLDNITLPAILTLEDGTTIPFNVGEAINITVPENIGHALDIDASIDFNALLRNETNLELDADLDLHAGKLGLNTSVGDVSVGPLVDESLNFFNRSFELFDHTFALGGFNQEEISFEVDIAIASLRGTPGNDNITGTAADERIDAMAGDDIVAAGPGDDILLGGNGDDTLDGGFGFDVIDGGAGIDSTTYDFYSGPIIADLQSGVVSFPGNSTSTDTLISIENLVGTRGNDTIAGGTDDNRLFGGDGDDVLRGDRNQRSAQDGKSGGNDYLDGGAGNDRIGGKGGDDTLLGGTGDDHLWGDDGDDVLRGGLGDDRLVGDNDSKGTGSDTFVLARGEGTDTILDFEIGIDFIGLADGLTFGDLTFADNAIQANNETLAILQGVNTAILSASTFIPA
ncbi:MAG: calcium-binding protein [Leptolyngbyaceae cyanobacterium]